MTSFKRGDVVLVDLGYAAKVRPCVVVSIPNADKSAEYVGSRAFDDGDSRRRM
jgi:mRNA-degrading endonuclease toxin of MazEF toxin-antitoxin module